ncbi:MAG: hypothetical protein WCW36_03595 [Candidatus Paceibacterota bacterium]
MSEGAPRFRDEDKDPSEGKYPAKKGKGSRSERRARQEIGAALPVEAVLPVEIVEVKPPQEPVEIAPTPEPVPPSLAEIYGAETPPADIVELYGKLGRKKQESFLAYLKKEQAKKEVIEAKKARKASRKPKEEKMSAPVALPEVEFSQEDLDALEPEVEHPVAPEHTRKEWEDKLKETVGRFGDIEISGGDIAASLNVENRGFFGSMSEAGKRIATQAYEGLHKIPFTDNVIGDKLGIAYNRFWLDKHEKKAAALKSEMDSLDLQSKAFDESKKEMESVFKNLGIEGSPKLLLDLKNMDRRKTELLNKKDRIQSEFEARENKAKLYTNERDRIADKLISRYDEKLKPIEDKLEQLKTDAYTEDLLAEVAEVKQKELVARLIDIRKRETRIEESLSRAGMSVREVGNNEAIKMLRGILAQGRNDLIAGKKLLEQQKRRRSDIYKKLMKVDAKSNPYRDSREKIVRVKDGRPIDFGVGTRTRGEVFSGIEGIETHPRAEWSPTSEEATVNTPEEVAVETAEVSVERPGAAFLAGLWNSYIKTLKMPDGKTNVLLIDEKDFLGEARLPGSYPMNLLDFEKILKKYYRLKRMPLDGFDRISDDFRKSRPLLKRHT